MHTKDTDTFFILPEDLAFTGIFFGEFLRFASHSSTREHFNLQQLLHSGFPSVTQEESSDNTRQKSSVADLSLSIANVRVLLKHLLLQYLTYVTLTSIQRSFSYHYPQNSLNSSLRNLWYVLLCDGQKVSQSSYPSSNFSKRTNIVRHMQQLYQHFHSACNPVSLCFRSQRGHPKQKEKLVDWLTQDTPTQRLKCDLQQTLPPFSSSAKDTLATINEANKSIFVFPFQETLITPFLAEIVIFLPTSFCTIAKTQTDGSFSKLRFFSVNKPYSL